MKEIVKDWSIEFYTFPIMIAIALIALVVSIRNRKKIDEINFFYIYLLASLAQGMIYHLSYFYNSEYKDQINRGSVKIFVLLEFILIYYFFFKIFKKRFKLILFFLIAL